MKTNSRRLRLVATPALALILAVPLFTGGCSAKDAAEALQGCDELKSGASIQAGLTGSVEVDTFMQATADLMAISDKLKVEVGVACAAIAKDLGATDSWTAKGFSATNPSDDSIKEACTQASAKIKAVMDAGAQANANIAITVSGGKCEVNAQAQFDCEAKCQATGMCEPPSIEARCEPGQLSVQCMGTCNAQATCEGSATVKANCEGTCAATCEGDCQGTCTAEGGTQTTNSATCNGKCSGTCKGTCTGECKVTATGGVSCGAQASCKGGCTGTATAPKCEGEIKPPNCQIDAECQGSCSGSASLKATCTPPQVKVIANASATSDIPKLVATLEANLPKLINAAKVQGQLALKASAKVASAGSAVVSAAGSLGGKAIACATASAQASAKASVSVSVSVEASASASGSAGTT